MSELTYYEAMASPCDGCDAPCCRYLPLQTFDVTTFVQLDYAVYLLNFDGIELGLSPSGSWSVYYRQPCRFLDRETALCTIHGTEAKPHICTQYNPYNCWYRPALTGDGVSSNHLRVDRRRMAHVLAEARFDEQRRLVDAPSWEQLSEAFAAIPIDSVDGAPPPDDATFDAWYELARSVPEGPEGPVVAAPSPPEVHGFEAGAVKDPCSTCAAHCCTNLTFPLPAVASSSNVDYMRFALGFPGVELVVNDDVWELSVRTTCRHLDAGRCGIFGQQERPLRCQFYDAWTCQYRPVFEPARPEGAVRVRLEEFPKLVELYVFDDAGHALAVPPVEIVRLAIEDGWRTGELAREVNIPVGRSLPLIT